MPFAAVLSPPAADLIANSHELHEFTRIKLDIIIE
jgi:hypothetical protein